MKIWAGYQKGINLGGWFSQCDHKKETYDNFIKEEDFKVISGWGCDHVRLPIDYELVELDDGIYSVAGFEYIEKAIEWAGKYRLNLILDLHKTFGYSFDKGYGENGFFVNEVYQNRFYKLWEELAKHFGKYSDRVSFELLNEVTDKAYMPKWSEIIDTCIKKIRVYAPNTYILIGGYWNNSVTAVPDLPLPADNKVIYNFHCYDPLIFTHQGAPWVDKMPHDFRIGMDAPISKLKEESLRIWNEPHFDEGINDSKPIDSDYFEFLFKDALKAADERKVALYCGEYGVINLASPEDTLAWFKAINGLFKKYGIGRAAWSYRRMDFGFVDEHMSGILDDIINYL